MQRNAWPDQGHAGDTEVTGGDETEDVVSASRKGVEHHRSSTSLVQFEKSSAWPLQYILHLTTEYRGSETFSERNQRELYR